MTAPLVSVVVLGFNRRDETRECLASIRAQAYRPVEVIVVDNGSTDGTVEMVAREFPEARLVALSRNIGACAGRNRALEDARGDYILQVDNDATIAPAGAVGRMVERMESEPDLGIVFSRVEDPATGRAYRPGYGSSFVDDEFYTWRFHGCAAMIRKAAIDKAGYYLPEEFFRAAEENDLAVRVLDAGYGILYMPSVVAHHKLSPRSRHNAEIVYLTVRNNLRVAWKFYPLPRAMALTLWRAPHYLVTRLAAGDASALWRVFAAMTGQFSALARRRPVRRETMALIDALTRQPALSADQMRAMRASPPRTAMLALVRRRLFEGAR